VRTRLFTMKMTDEEHARFARVAKRWGINIANLLRALVAREDEATRAAANTMHRSLRARKKARQP